MAGKSAEGSGTTVLFIAPGQTVQPKTKAYLPSMIIIMAMIETVLDHLPRHRGGSLPARDPQERDHPTLSIGLTTGPRALEESLGSGKAS